VICNSKVALTSKVHVNVYVSAYNVTSPPGNTGGGIVQNKMTHFMAHGTDLYV